HVNEQWPAYWARLFAALGYVPIDCLRRQLWDDERVEWWYAQNILLFAGPGQLEALPSLKQAHALAGGPPPAVVHPQRYLEWVEWGLEQSRQLHGLGPDAGPGGGA